MNAADYLAIFVVFMCTFVNRQSIFILYAYLLTECAFYLTSSDFQFSVISSCIYAALALWLPRIKFQLQLALILYAVFYWLNGLDYWVSEYQTYFYVIFPYVIKLIDVYVIYHLIHKGHINDGLYNTRHSSFN